MEKTVIDLQPFCSKDASRTYLLKPFSRGEFSYATNGHIMVRVPRRSDIGEDSKAPATEKVFDDNVADGFEPAPVIKLPDLTEMITKEECQGCENHIGKGCECEMCQCTCDECDGTGEVESESTVSVGIKGAIYMRKYIAMLLALPDLEFGPIHKTNPLRFRFNGGEALLQPMRGRADDHFEIIPLTSA